VKEGRIYLIESDLLDRPSPRIVKGLENMARVIHPEVEWGSGEAKQFYAPDDY
jgi:iron complex transport system substrate-binding protein